MMTKSGWAIMIKSLPAWGVWIEIDNGGQLVSKLQSLPAWGVWIEMRYQINAGGYTYVAPRMGSVD